MGGKVKIAVCPIILTVILLCVLCSCGAPSKSEKEIVADLQTSEAFLPSHDVTINDYEIIKRQTSPEDKTDIIYITVDAENEEFTCKVSYTMTYGLYNDGWSLDDVSRYYEGEWSGHPLVGVPEDAIQATIGSELHHYEYRDRSLELMNIIEEDLDLQAGTSIVYYTYALCSTYGQYEITGYIPYAFNQESFYYYPSGEFSVTEVSCTLYDTNIGETFRGGHLFIPNHSKDIYSMGDLYLTIDDVNGNHISGHGKLEGALSIKGHESYQMPYFTFAGNAVAKVYEGGSDGEPGYWYRVIITIDEITGDVNIPPIYFEISTDFLPDRSNIVDTCLA